MSSVIIIILLIVIIALVVGKKNNGVESLGNSTKNNQRNQAQALNKSGEPTKILIVEPYRGKTKMAAIKAIREVNHVIGLKEAKAIVDNGGELELYIAQDQLLIAKEMLEQTGMKFKSKF